MAGKEGRGKARSEELELLRDWSVALLEFELGLVEDELSREMFQGMIAGTHRAFEKRNLRGLRGIAADLLESADGLSIEAQMKLDEILREKIGRGLFQEIQNTNKRISFIIERGRIADEDEYRLLLARAGDVEKIGKDTEAIERLLLEFGQNHGTADE